MKRTRKSGNRWRAACLTLGCGLLGASLAGAAEPPPPCGVAVTWRPAVRPEAPPAPPQAPPPARPAAPPPLTLTAAKEEAPACTPLFSPDDIFPAGTEVLPVDLPTALRLADASNPTVALARLRVAEAYARLDEAQLLWLPNLQAGTQYLRHDGEIQNALGLVFPTNKSSIFVVGGAVADVRTADALFLPLIERRLAQAQAAEGRAVSHDVQLEVALGYLDLLQAYAQLAVNADLLARAREVLNQAEIAQNTQLAKSGADVNRARTEVQLRLTERTFLRGQVRVASSRLARLLLLPPTVGLLPADPVVVPVTLLPEDGPLEPLVNQALAGRPETERARALVAAGEVRLRQGRLDPLLPRLQVGYTAGGFGGGINDQIHNFNGRGDGTAAAVWELRGLGFANAAENRVRRIQVGEANAFLQEVQARVADEVVEAAQVARARREALDSAQAAVREAVETYRKLRVIAFGMTGPKKELESLEPLLAIQLLAQARGQYLNAVMDYNRAQFRLYTAVGQPSLEALGKACRQPVEVPVTPPPYAPTRP
jgi:outer membrane protein TolC